MHTDENNVIRYLMKEMDPSEEMEFEKKIREDENLLIEVESLRATNRKLAGLPLQNPPKHLTQKIANEAKQLQSKKVRNNNTLVFIAKRGIAAAILLSAFTGGYYYFSGTSNNAQTGVDKAERTQPWVDRNEVIRFSGNLPAAQSSTLQNDFTKSFEKLQLVNDPTGTVSGSNGILLTGSSK
jgi:hypothetical protein